MVGTEFMLQSVGYTVKFINESELNAVLFWGEGVMVVVLGFRTYHMLLCCILFEFYGYEIYKAKCVADTSLHMVV